MKQVLVYHPTRSMEYGQLLAPLLPEAKLLVAATAEEAAEAIGEADVAFVWRLPLPLWGRARRLHWVQAMGAGVEDLVGAPLPDGCALTRVEGLFGGYMSEFAFSHMLAHTQQLRRLYANQAARRWEPFQIGLLAGKRLGVAGAGSIGGAIAHLGKAFGMEVWALTRHQRPLTDVDRCFLPGETAQFLGGVDYLVSSLPLTAETVGLIDPRLMKAGSLLINIGRGATVNEEALLSAARAGRVQ
ncbi:MAG: NAD(P)-dependent oxidoreductase, partial [Mycobacterium leprae]